MKLLAMLLLATSFAKHPTSIPQPTGAAVNPYTYKVGSVILASPVGDDGAALRIQPLGSSLLYTEDILFCNFDPDKFNGKTNPLVLTYRTRASRMLDGVGCHDLLRVDNLERSRQ